MRVHLTLKLKIGRKTVKRSGRFLINPDLFAASPDKQVATIAKRWLKSIRSDNFQPVILVKAIYNGNIDITKELKKQI